MPSLGTGVLAAGADAARGNLFPQPWLQCAGRRVRMDDACGRGWRLVWAPGCTPPPAVSAAPALALRSLARLDEADGVLAGWFETHRCVAALVRPDHRVFGLAAGFDGIGPLLGQAATCLA
jgi:3-(3-hydroxy-phenyl)propionate hydroxylase